MLENNTIILGRYQILDIAGQGGMGRVYHAVDLEDQSHWAIKEDLSDDTGVQLQEEAAVLKELEHPALPKTRGVVQWNNCNYMIMEFMEGETLSAMLSRQEKYPEAQVLDWFLQITEVLCYLHGRPRPIVYRDLKPSNIIIDEQGRVRIIDFGIAEEYSRQDSQEAMKKGGLSMGFAAPEQYSARFKADVRTDIYALGVTIHYLLTGKNPAKPPYGFVPVRKLSPRVSYAMEEIVGRCLQPNPDRRYRTAEMLHEALLRIDDRNRELRSKRRRRTAAVALGAVLVLTAACTVGQMFASRRKKQIDAYDTMVEQACAAAENGNFSQAMETAEMAIADQPDEISGYLAVGYCYMLQEDYDQCMWYITNEILDRFPDCYRNAGFNDLMAQIYDRSGSPEEALYYYRRRCELVPEDPEGWLDLAQCYIRLEEFEKAEDSLDTYLQRGGDPGLFDALRDQIRKNS